MKPFKPRSLPLRTINWPRLIPLLGPANRALSNFNGILYGLRNPEILLAPLTTQEAVLSSRIEGTQATLGEVLKFEAGEAPPEESRREDIQEILNYRQALERSQEELKTRPFNLNLLLILHNILLDSFRGRDKGRGHFRTLQNWIGSPGCSMAQATFVPPDPASLPASLDNWEQYYHADTPDLLVQLALIHAQFEIIHPFLDGNGRLGRILIHLFLFERGLLSRPVFYLSAYLEAHRDQYLDTLGGIGRKNEGWTQWIEFFLIAITRQAEVNLKAARGILELYERLKSEVIMLTHSQYAVPVLDVIFERPILSTNAFDHRPDMPSKTMVARILAQFKNAGILSVIREQSGRKPQILVFDEVLRFSESTAGA